MPEPAELLLITHNRLPYVKKSVARLFEDQSDFRVYWWDNASKDGTTEWVESLNEPRIVRKHHSEENVNQRDPTFWFFQESKSDVLGKIDDDILLPPGWTAQLARMVRADSRYGVLGCWIFMEEDWSEDWANRRAIYVGGYKVLRNVGVQGQSCLARKEVLTAYASRDGYGFPVDQVRMTRDGFINGFPMPPPFGHNMDDPRSPHYIAQREDQKGITAVKLGFKTTESYAKWIEADAWERQRLPFPIQRALYALDGMDGRVGNVLRRMVTPVLPTARAMREGKG